jgi:hypothetical protein
MYMTLIGGALDHACHIQCYVLVAGNLPIKTLVAR